MDRWGISSPNAWSTIFAALAPSTQQSYKLIFSKFLVFLKDKNVTVNTVSLANVFDFLEPLIVEKRAASTLRSYVASLKFYLKLFQRNDIVQSPLFDLFASGAQRKAPLPKAKNWIWDAGIPLKMIRDRAPPPDFLSAAREAVFLIMLATGLRVGDMFLLGEDFSLSHGTFVIPFLGKRKRKIKGRWTTEQRISSYPGNERLCPGNALLLYATFSVPLRVQGEKALFISSTGRQASKATLGGWVKDILSDAGISATAGSCRSATTSAAFLRKVPIDVIMSSAGWSNDLTFFRHYQRDVAQNAFGANLLPVL
jgi:site-specific recombinase XerD